MLSICRKLSLVLLVATATHALRPLPRPLRTDPTFVDEVLVTHHPNGLAHVLLNRPKAINALSTTMLQELLDLLDQEFRPSTCTSARLPKLCQLKVFKKLGS